MAPLPPQSEPERVRPAEFVAVGRVVRPHGVRGNLLVEAISDLIHSLEQGVEVHLGDSERKTRVKYLRSHQNRYLLAVEGVHDRSEAEQYRGAEVLLSGQKTEDLPEGTYYHWQIVGLNVISDEGESLGTISRILETGANDVYVVEKEGAKELLLPAIDSVIVEVDLEQETLVVRLLPGLRD